MKILQSRWVFWFGLAGFVSGAIAAPSYLLWQILISLNSMTSSGNMYSGIFTYFDDAWSIRGSVVWFIIAWIGASLGGVIGLMLGFAITKLKKL